jgi:hypothetical protein
MSISSYFRPYIHQNGPKILGVNGFAQRFVVEIIYSSRTKADYCGLIVDGLERFSIAGIEGHCFL